MHGLSRFLFLSVFFQMRHLYRKDVERKEDVRYTEPLWPFLFPQEKVFLAFLWRKSMWCESGKNIALSISVALLIFYLSSFFFFLFCGSSSFFLILVLVLSLEDSRVDKRSVFLAYRQRCAKEGQDHALPAYAIARFAPC